MKKIARYVLSFFPKSFEESLRFLVHRVRDSFGLARAYRYDFDLYRRYSGIFRPSMQGVIEAKIIKAYHRVEKGLSLADPRPGFGKDAVQTVLDGVEQYVQRFGQNHTTHRALNTLKEYVRFNSANNADVAWVEARLQRLGNSIGSENAGGTRRVTRDEIAAAANIDLKDFFNSRYSIRQFTSQAVDDDLLTQAVQMAKKTPSVCNRESGCVFVVSDQEQKARLLSLQNGNRGFGDQADRVLVITSRLDAFLTVGERYQCWIDGGLFAMSLIYALHSLGLGSCCLNWSVEPEADQAMKQLPGIPKGHAIIMLLAVGHIPAELLVAQSPRRPLNEVLNFI